MLSLLRKAAQALRARREARAMAVLDRLKARYHTFRVILDANERALKLITDLDAGLRARNQAALAGQAEALLDVTYTLVDALNRLTDNGHAALYAAHDRLADEIRRALPSSPADVPGQPRVVALDDLGPDLWEQAGGKASSLARLRRAGLPVPDGFVATTRATRSFLAASSLDVLARRRLGKAEAGGDVESASREVVEAVLAAPVPGDLADELLAAWDRLAGDGPRPAVSLRSSALVEDRPEHSFAGQFRSVLNVVTADGLLQAFKEVVASNFGSRPTRYRLNAGLPAADLDMAVLCQVMVPARVAGVLFTLAPSAKSASGDESMLLSAVAGLGTQAVGGSAPADLYRPSRDGKHEPSAAPEIAIKTHKDIPLAEGGLASVEVGEAERRMPLLSPDEVARLAKYGMIIEGLAGVPQDIEWAVTDSGAMRILQARPARTARRAGRGGQGKPEEEAPAGSPSPVLLSGGSCASSGRAVGLARIVRSTGELRQAVEEGRTDGMPRILVLHQGIVDAAPLLTHFEGVAVDLGNPADHLSCVAREQGVPMLTGLGRATESLLDGQRIMLDADRGVILAAPYEAFAAHATRKRQPGAELPKDIARLREMVVPLSLTDAYGPTFSIRECRTLHDIVRYTHEMAVLAMFETGDEVLEEAGGLVRRLDLPLNFLLIDLGGGVAPKKDGSKGRRLATEDIRSAPLAALCRGISTPGLRWRAPVPAPGVTGLVSRSLLDGRTARPLGNMNYALVTRDYLNLNARVDYHFAMVDAVCGPASRANYVRFRFKGGGTALQQRERRARFVARVLGAHGFFTDQRGDLVTASLAGIDRDAAEEALVMLGRLLGFSRLLDAAMVDEGMPERVAEAFLAGDWGLEGLK